MPVVRLLAQFSDLPPTNRGPASATVKTQWLWGSRRLHRMTLSGPMTTAGGGIDLRHASPLATASIGDRSSYGKDI